MNTPRLSRRTAVLGAAALGLGSKRVLAQSTPVASPAASPFPVTIEHVYGATTIESKPERVVTLGWSSYDAVIALGVIPVGVPANTFGGDADGFLPWTREALGDAPLPATLDTDAGIPFEAIAALDPDVILAPYSGVTEEEYGTLSQFAPTVPFKETAWSGSWQEITRTCGEALGLAEEAEQLIAETDAYVETEAAKYPVLAGKTFVYGTMAYSTTDFNIYTVTDARSLFLTSIGLEPSDFVKNLPVSEASPYYSPISYERANEIEGDIVVFWFAAEADYEAAKETSYFQAIPAVARGTFAPIIGEDLVMATSAFSTLSIAYALEAFLPALAEAAENVPAS